LPSVRGLIGRYAPAGVKVDDLRTFGSTPETGVQSVGGATVYVFNQRPHPNAARVFISWFLSKEVQHGFAMATQQASRRTDVPHAGEPEAKPIKGAKYITTQREDNKAALDKTIAFIEEVRRNAK
jgi:ABC-type Fe3+ transport system substrate-binding protein